MTAARHLVVGIGVRLTQDITHRVIGQMDDGEILAALGDPHHRTVDLWRTMDDGRPVGHVATEEPQHIVGIGTVEKTPHEIVLPWDGDARGRISARSLFVEIVAQRRRHHLVGIDHQHPGVGGLVDGKLAGRLHDGMVGLGEGHDSATMTAGDVEGRVLTLHIADEHLVEALHGLEHLLQMFLRITRVDDDGYAVLFAHWVQRYK